MASPILPRLDGAGDSVAMIAKWIRRCGLPFAILGWTGVALLLLWLAGHILQTLLLLTIAALLAYALSPVVKLLTRIMPRVLAILVPASGPEVLAALRRERSWHRGGEVCAGRVRR